MLDRTRKGETSPKQGDLTLRNQSAVKARFPLPTVPRLIHRASDCGRGSGALGSGFGRFPERHV